MVNDMQRYMVLNKNLELDQSDKRHIIQVMKMKIGEEFEIVFDKQVFLCSITSISKKNLTYQIVSKYDIDNLKKYNLVLLKVIYIIFRHYLIRQILLTNTSNTT